MVTARSAAMGFNRLVDAHYDARNPRTSMREIPRGVMSRAEATVFVTISAAAFIASSWMINTLCGLLSPVALAIVFWYSLAKRFTSYTQAFLGLAMAVAPVGRSIPVRFGIPRALTISRLMHVATVMCMAALALVAPLGSVYLFGVAFVAALLVYEQSLVTSTDLSQVKRAFDLNGYVGIVYFLTTAAAVFLP
jgi:4-hydroxybenzoate polyprenyltransferase